MNYNTYCSECDRKINFPIRGKNICTLCDIDQRRGYKVRKSSGSKSRQKKGILTHAIINGAISSICAFIPGVNSDWEKTPKGEQLTCDRCEKEILMYSTIVADLSEKQLEKLVQYLNEQQVIISKDEIKKQANAIVYEIFIDNNLTYHAAKRDTKKVLNADNRRGWDSKRTGYDATNSDRPISKLITRKIRE